MIWFLIGIIIFTFSLNKITLKYGFSNLFYSMEIPKKVVEIGEDINIISIFENKKPLSISFLQVEENFPKGFNVEEYRYTSFILPYQRVKRTYSIKGEDRGVYHIRDISLGLGDFVGFKTIYKNLSIDKEIVVLPKRLDLNENIIPFGSLNGNISVRRWIMDDPLMTIEVKEYTGREPEKHIHWPSSLRYGDLMVKNFDFTTDNSIIIVLNIESSKPHWLNINREAIEESISLVRGIMEELEEKKIPYGFTTNAYEASSLKDQFYYPGIGKNQLNYFLEVLGRMNYAISSPFEKFLEKIIKKRGNYSTYIVVTPKIFNDYISPLNIMSKSVEKLVLISLETENLGELNKNIVKHVRG